MNAPNVFVSHASEDKPFVLPLAARLRTDGVEAWVDKWELLAGDSLVRRIFEEGIGGCDAFLIVLSKISVEKPWVREELDAAFALTIEKSTRLIAVRIDDCEVPVVLKSRVWINMDPASSIDDVSYRQLLNAIYERREKPPLGASPFAAAPAPSFGHTLDETKVLDASLKLAMNARHPLDVIDAASLESETGLPAQTVRDAVDMLESDGDLKLNKLGTGEFSAQLTPWGWQKRAQVAVGIDADDDMRRLLAVVISDGPGGLAAVASTAGLDIKRAFLATKLAEARGYVRVAWTGQLDGYGAMHIGVTQTGRKYAR